MLVIELPNLKKILSSDESDEEYYWVNSIGHALIRYIEVEIGGNVIDRHYGMWLNIWSELSTPPGKKDGLYSLIGKTSGFTNIYDNEKDNIKLYIPLYFWFCKNLGSALPIIALQNSELRINIGIRDINELVVTKSGNDLTIDQKSRIEIKNSSLYVSYIFLDDTERKYFAQSRHEYLIEQLQVNPIALNTIGRNPDTEKAVKISNFEHLVPLEFSHPVKELIWVLQNSNVISKRDSENNLISYGGNQWFNYSNKIFTVDASGLQDIDGMLESAKLLFEGKDRIELRDADFFRLVQPYLYHTNVLENNYIYIYSFSEDPELFQPMGSCNFSRIDNANMLIKLNKDDENIVNPVITFFAVNYNTLYIEGGLAGIGYSN